MMGRARCGERSARGVPRPLFGTPSALLKGHPANPSGAGPANPSPASGARCPDGPDRDENPSGAGLAPLYALSGFVPLAALRSLCAFCVSVFSSVFFCRCHSAAAAHRPVPFPFRALRSHRRARHDSPAQPLTLRTFFLDGAPTGSGLHSAARFSERRADVGNVGQKPASPQRLGAGQVKLRGRQVRQALQVRHRTQLADLLPVVLAEQGEPVLQHLRKRG